MKHLSSINVNFNKIPRKVLFEKHKVFQRSIFNYITSLFDDVVLDFYEFPSSKTHFITFSHDKFIFGFWNLSQQKFFLNYKVVYHELKNIILQNRKIVQLSGGPANNFPKINDEIGQIFWEVINGYLKKHINDLNAFGLSFTDSDGSWLSETKYRNKDKKYILHIHHIVTNKENDTTKIMHRMKHPNRFAKILDEIILCSRKLSYYNMHSFNKIFNIE